MSNVVEKTKYPELSYIVTKAQHIPHHMLSSNYEKEESQVSFNPPNKACFKEFIEFYTVYSYNSSFIQV